MSLYRRYFGLILLALFAVVSTSAKERDPDRQPYKYENDKLHNSYIKDAFQALGYSLKDGNIVDGEGTPLTNDQRHRLGEPFDAAKDNIPSDFLKRAGSYGYEIRTVNGKRLYVHAKTGRPSTRLDVLYAQSQFKSGEMKPGREQALLSDHKQDSELVKGYFKSAGLKVDSKGGLLGVDGKPMSRRALSELYLNVEAGKDSNLNEILKGFGAKRTVRRGVEIFLMPPGNEPLTAIDAVILQRNLGMVGVSELDAPYDIRGQPFTDGFKNALGLLGYKVDSRSGRVSSNGKPLTAREFVALNYPYHESNGKLPEKLIGPSKYRRGEHNGKPAVFRVGFPQPITTIQARMLIKTAENNDLLIGRMGVFLKGKSPDRLLNKSELDELRTLAAKEKGALPPAIQKALMGGKSVRVSDLRRTVESAAVESTRFWDGNKTVGELERLAGEPTITLARQRQQGRKAYKADLGLHELLKKDLTDVFSKSSVAGEVLDQFLVKGELKLPTLLVREIPRSKAQYNPGHDTVSIDLGWVQDRFKARLLEVAGDNDKKKEFYLKMLGEERRFNTLLLNDATVRKAFVEEFDSAFLHELTHGGQARRNKSQLEELRGNLISVNDFEEEHEAWLMEARYFHEKLMDPKQRDKAMTDRRLLGSYQLLNQDFDRWRDGVSQIYANGGVRSSSLKTVAEMQDWKMKIARKLGAESFVEGVRQKFKLLGLTRGSKELEKTRADYRRRMATFKSGEYKQMRRDGLPILIDGFMKKKHFVGALPLLQERKRLLERGLRRGEAGITRDAVSRSFQQAEEAALRGLQKLGKTYPDGRLGIEFADESQRMMIVEVFMNYYANRRIAPSYGVGSLAPPPPELKILTDFLRIKTE